MRTITEINQRIAEVSKEIQAKRSTIAKTGSDSEKEKLTTQVNKITKRLQFYRNIVLYLEYEPMEEYLKTQETKLTARIAQVDEKIAHMKETYRSSTALSNGMKNVKAEFNYAKNKEQLEIIQFILN